MYMPTRSWLMSMRMEEFTSRRVKHGDVNATNSYTDYRQIEGLVEGVRLRRSGMATLAFLTKGKR
jgi:hypothetical protein